MAIPENRLDDTVHATQFRAFAGLVLSVEPHYCDIATKDIPQVELSPVIQADFSTRRVCLGDDLTLDIDNSYSPFHNIAFYRIQWGDGGDTGWVAWAGGPGAIAYGAAAGEWPIIGVYAITISVRDDAGGGVGGPFETTIEEQIEVVDCPPFDAWAGFNTDGVYRAQAAPWVARNAGLTGSWLHVNDINVNNNVRIGGHAETWIATNAGLAYSRDGGATWTKVVLDDPPNSWGAVPAPTAADLTFWQIERSVIDPNEVYVIAGYDAGAFAWRGWLGWTTDNFQSITWYGLGYDSQTAATWGYVQGVSPYSCTAYNDEGLWTDYGSWRINGAPDGAYGGAQVNWPDRQDLSVGRNLLYCDLGAWVTLTNATLSGGINVESRVGSCVDTMTRVATNMKLTLENMTWGHSGPYFCTNAGQTLLQWTEAVDGWPVVAPSIKSATINSPITKFRWVVVELSEGAGGTYTGTGLTRQLLDYIRVYPHAAYVNVRPLSISLDKEFGRYLYMTTWEGDAVILRGYDTAFSRQHPIKHLRVYGVASWADVVNRNQWARVISPDLNGFVDDYGRRCMVYGHFSAAPARHLMDYYMMKGAGWDTSTVFTYIGDATWTTEYIGAMVNWDGELMQVFLNSGASRFWETLDGGANWTNIAAMPFQAEAMAWHPDYEGEFLIGNRAAAGADPRAEYSMSDGRSWFDASAGLPAGADMNVVKLLSERWSV